jgi:D-sedoheptulose 7-phosphate isomerase
MPFTSEIKTALQDAKAGLDALLARPDKLDAISQAGTLMANALRQGHRIYSCGNGGSMCDAMHFAEELTGRYRKDRPAYAAIAISDPSHLACVGNDYGYEFVFSRYLEAHGRAGDVLLAISTSGSSKNVIKAVEVAKSRGMHVVALTGKDDCILGSMSSQHIATPAGAFADRVQELHIKVIHIFIELIERHLAPQNYR